MYNIVMLHYTATVEDQQGIEVYHRIMTMYILEIAVNYT